MKLRLETCEHAKVEPIRVVDDLMIVTCVLCYRRYQMYAPGGRTPSPHLWLSALPPAPCPHTQKKPMQKALTKSRSYYDALCLACGKVLRHPDGPGAWEDVLFYDYLIVELPSVNMVGWSN